MNRRAFTLLELLISLALIALLIGLVLVALSGARTSATRTGSLNALRQMLMGYTGYSTDHNGVLLPGFLGLAAMDPSVEDLQELGIKTYLDRSRLDPKCPECPVGLPLKTEEMVFGDSRAYLWRLAPYLDGWRVTFADYGSKRATSHFESEFAHGTYGPETAAAAMPCPPECPLPPIGMSRVPSFGLNSLFLGGDTQHGGAAVVAQNPFGPAGASNGLAATRLNQVRNPARIVVFGATAMINQSALNHPLGREIAFGYPELRPPFTSWNPVSGSGIDPQWSIVNGVIEPTGPTFANGGGVPVGRWGEDNVPVAHLDGSAEVLNRYEMSVNMGFWSPFFVGVR